MLNPRTKGWGVYELTHRQTEKLLAELRRGVKPLQLPNLEWLAGRAEQIELNRGRSTISSRQPGTAASSLKPTPGSV